MRQIKKGTKLYSIINLKCPHCHEGDFFKNNNFYNFKSPSASFDVCLKCNRRLYIEPGFYYGAMYVSYAMEVAHAITLWVAQMVLGIEVKYWTLVIFVALTLLAVTPFYYGMSKIIWANMFLNYKGIENEES